MKPVDLLVVTQVRVYKNGDGLYADASFAKIVERYSKEFGKIFLVTRVCNSDTINDGFVNIGEYCRGYYNVGSVLKFLLKKKERRLKEALNAADLVVLRLPSLVSIRMYSLIKKLHKKYLAEVMGCAWDAYWNHSLPGKMVAIFATLKMKKIVKNADYSIYVTNDFLQKRYPCKGKSVGISDVNIKTIDGPKKYSDFNHNSFTMMTAGAINVRYKGQRYAISAMRSLERKYGISIKYYLAGKGDTGRLKKVAKKYGVYDRVVFLGMLSSKDLAEKMKGTDIYIQPSLQEGLPRAVVEAMSHGCVCIGARTGGIPELLDEKCIFKRKSSKAIVEMILKSINSDLHEISYNNTVVAKDYMADKLETRRKKFYLQIINEIRKEK